MTIDDDNKVTNELYYHFQRSPHQTIILTINQFSKKSSFIRLF